MVMIAWYNLRLELPQNSRRANIQHLPAQSLDYITGYLATFAVMETIRRRSIDGRGVI